MKTFVSFVLASIVSASAFATIDSHDHVFVVVQHIQSGEFFVERVPVIGCYGPFYGPQLIQFTSEYRVTANIGCGGERALDNINYLTCAKIVDHQERADTSMKSMTLDISKCADKNDSGFLTAVKSAVNLNFGSKRSKPELKLIK